MKRQINYFPIYVIMTFSYRVFAPMVNHKDLAPLQSPVILPRPPTSLTIKVCDFQYFCRAIVCPSAGNHFSIKGHIVYSVADT